MILLTWDILSSEKMPKNILVFNKDLDDQTEAPHLGDSFLTLQENDRKSPSSDSADSAEFSDPPISREAKTHNTSKQKKRFLVGKTNESVDEGNIQRMENLKKENEKLSRGLNIIEQFQSNLKHK